jgi:cytochrome c2
MKASRSRAMALRGTLAACTVAALAGAAYGEQDDRTAGAKLYVAQCKICHGSASAFDQDMAAPAIPAWQLTIVAMQHGAPGSGSDAPPPVTVQPAAGQAPTRLAFAPPFGPPLNGVYMRPAGSVENFDYSKTFMATLKGMEWNEAALDVWITNPQAWVPGVYMFYKQPDPEVRRKLIVYLKSAR